MTTYITIDIGGTFIKYALLNEQLELIHLNKVPTQVNKDQAIVNQVKQIVEQFNSSHTIVGIGISTAGIVDRKRGKIIYAGPTILDYVGTNFKEALASFNLPVHVTNDVDSALLGEIWKSDINLTESTFCLTLGTGIGGALYDNGIKNGANLQANSIGYLLYDPVTQSTFEMRASTSALNKRIANEIDSSLSTEHFFEQAKQGNEQCESILIEWTKEIAAGIAQIILILDPKRIIIGGGVSVQGDFLLNHIKQQIPVFLPNNFIKTDIIMATQKNNASLYGAVYSFFNENS